MLSKQAQALIEPHLTGEYLFLGSRGRASLNPSGVAVRVHSVRRTLAIPDWTRHDPRG